jgi:hypothetical protein
MIAGFLTFSEFLTRGDDAATATTKCWLCDRCAHDARVAAQAVIDKAILQTC